MRALICLLLSVGIGMFAGCKSADASRSNRVHAEITAANANRVAADVLPQLRAAFKPGITTFRLKSRNSTPSIADALETGLRKAGYAVTADLNEPGAVVLGYTVDPFEVDGIRVLIFAGDSFQANRLYVQNDDGTWEPDGVLTERVEPVAAGRPKRLRSWAGLLDQSKAIKGPAREANLPGKGLSAAKIASETPQAPKSRASAPSAVVSEGPVLVAKPTASEQASPPASSVSAGQPPASDEDTIVLSPNSDGVIEISAALFAGADAVVPDPFVQHYQPKKLSHEFAISIAGIALGPQPTVVLNDRVYSLGESVEGFRVEAVREDLVLLRRDNFLLRIPLQEKPVVVRYP